MVPQVDDMKQNADVTPTPEAHGDAYIDSYPHCGGKVMGPISSRTQSHDCPHCGKPYVVPSKGSEA